MTAVWGWTFVVVKDAIAQYPTLPFLTIRFALALLVMIVIVRRLPGRRVLVVGAAVGVAVAAGYVLQTVALPQVNAIPQQGHSVQPVVPAAAAVAYWPASLAAKFATFSVPTPVARS